MRIDKNGKVKLQSGDYRTGNFVFHAEPKHIKVTAISGVVSWRVSTDTAVGTMVLKAIGDKNNAWLATYAAMNLSQLCVVPDVPFFVKHAELVNGQTMLHPEFYGVSRKSEHEDKQIIEEQKELQQAVEK